MDYAFARVHPAKNFICSDNIGSYSDLLIRWELQSRKDNHICSVLSLCWHVLTAERVLCHLPPTLWSRRNTVFQPRYFPASDSEESLIYLSASSVARPWLKVFLRMCFGYLLCLVTKRGLISYWYIYAIMMEGVDRGGQRTSAI